jgi:hypothetical protein
MLAGRVFCQKSTCFSLSSELRRELGPDGGFNVSMLEKPGDALGNGHVCRLFIILQLARETQIAARPVSTP